MSSQSRQASPGQARLKPYLRSDTVHGLFASCVERWPDAVAIVHGRRRVTYRELDELSDYYAVELGARQGEFVPVLLPRTVEMVAVLLAILKSGAVYAALDPAWPRERHDSLIKRLAARQVVAAGDWPVPVWTPVAGKPAHSRKPAPVTVRGADPAQVFFTSGSTGLPKGVVVPHHGTARLYDECAHGDFGPGSVGTQTMPTQWDGSILDLWGPLLCGGTTVFVDEVLHPALLRRLIESEGLNTVCLPTAVFNLIMDEQPEAFDGIRYVNIGGEKVSDAQCRRFLTRYPDVPLTNTYGPVESTAIVTCRFVTLDDTTDPDGIPIGFPLTNSDVLVLDGDRVCPAGEVGELCLTGHGLALGYLGDPELTARQFTTVGGQRVYRTGDLGFATETGLLYYAGRRDRQVKIRGHRIEPGEVERVAEEIPGIGRGAVIPRKGPDGSFEALVLCYVTDTGLDEPSARAALAERLPAYLVPRDIYRVESFPLTVNGKVDRVALLAATTQAETVDTGGDLVHTLCQYVLGRPIPSTSDSLIELGVNSLELAKIATRLSTVLGKQLPISQLYRTPTIEGLSEWLAVDRPSTTDTSSDVITLTTGQANYLSTTDSTSCLLPWWVDGTLDTEALRAALADLHARHETLRARYLKTDPPSAEVVEDGSPEFHLLPDAIDAAAATATLMKTLHQPLDPAGGVIWRAALIRAGDRTLLGLAVHHIAFDGWSEALLTEDLGTAYRARAAGEAPQWTHQAPPMAAVAAEHRERVAATDLAAQRDYWRKRLRGLPRLRLPSPDSPEGPVEGRTFQITEAELRPWDQRAATEHATRFVYLVAVFAEVLRSVTGHWDIGMLAPVAMRGNPLLDATVTCRINPVCLRLRRPPGGTTDVWAQAREVVTEAFAAQDLPFGAVAAALSELGPFGSVLRTLPIFLVQDHHRGLLDLGATTGEFLTDRPGKDVPSTLAVEVFLDPDGATLRIGVRTDCVPAGTAETIGAEFLRILRAGPQAW